MSAEGKNQSLPRWDEAEKMELERLKRPGQGRGKDGGPAACGVFGGVGFCVLGLGFLGFGGFFLVGGGFGGVLGGGVVVFLGFGCGGGCFLFLWVGVCLVGCLLWGMGSTKRQKRGDAGPSSKKRHGCPLAGSEAAETWEPPSCAAKDDVRREREEAKGGHYARKKPRSL